MPLNLGETVPDFVADSTEGEIKFHSWLGDSWGILFSHPADFTPVCTTELGCIAKAAQTGEFSRRNTKIIALSVDSAEQHRAWIKDIAAFQGVEGAWPYPILSDTDRTLAVKWGMLDPSEIDSKGLPVTARAVFFIGPDKKVKAVILYPATTGRNVDELVRVLDSLQLTVKYACATPVNWKVGDQVMIQPSVSNEAAKDKFPKGWKTVEVPSKKEYIRLTPYPDH
ncbi:peroxidase [Capsaspora owczarzaki ATCC 30864]|uniref:Peroxidase n=1 Tax=Capsaspora owczarzaki (strain ATCC 30864) TaxID=595528 RepID=A0A0D2X2U8_CAPO3|nr:peroxidase [Capsaspora owczarzaki ATCC 30864]KJE93184.1 peroxidase [Capsaspora owczarzaki ATCC 30864]|eukprot:XP_004347834.1 peroxidase [Capsaspora owczarzaki ATCC 30864]